jgi:protein-L-isoaspartate O-methyltransferase
LYGSPDSAAVTQVTGGLPTSSMSCQAVVVGMLDALCLEREHRVLELGTGTGWNAALMAARAAEGRVVSVEVDPELAGFARTRLRAVSGPGVDVRVGDGAEGWSAGAPYDRVIATYAVDTVPWAWVEQCAPGGRVVFPWGRLGHVALTVAEDGKSASGWVQGLAQFMPARGPGAGTALAPTPAPASAPARARDYAAVRGTGPAATEHELRRDLTPLHDDLHLQFTLRVALPDVHITTAVDEDGVNAWLHDGRTSWASFTAEGDGTTTARQGGPRRLAGEVEGAWEQWLHHGSPELWDYGLTVTPDGQHAWCEDALSGARRPVGAALSQAAAIMPG